MPLFISRLITSMLLACKTSASCFTVTELGISMTRALAGAGAATLVALWVFAVFSGLSAATKFTPSNVNAA
jgi:hypothetical protein